MKPMYIFLKETHFLAPQDAQECGSLHVLYLFDADEEVLCCEVRPSYYLMAANIQTGNRVSEELHGQLHQHLYESDHYRLVANVLRRDPKPVLGDFETMEEALYYLRGNPPFLDIRH